MEILCYSGMLPDAVLPPFEDHTYAQWLERADRHKSPQPSPFKRVGNTPIKKIVPLRKQYNYVNLSLQNKMFTLKETFVSILSDLCWNN